MESAISVNLAQAQRMGARLVELDWRSAGYDTISAALPSGSSREAAVDYFFFTSMLLFDFKNVEATLPDGRYIKGTDVFFYLARRAGERKADFWTAASLMRATDEEMLSAFSLEDDPLKPSLPRCDERVALLRDAASVLLARWRGRVSRLLEVRPRLRGAVAGEAGLLDELVRNFKGYSDPLFKKAFVWLKALDVTGLWRPLDPENVQMPVDYHVIRLALRNGTVAVRDAALAERLRAGAPVTEAEEQALREVVQDAYHELIRASGLSVYFVDELFWLVGRSCCHYKRPPRCATCDLSDCTVQPAFSYTCPGRCPLATVCLGAADEHYRTLLEPTITTIHY